MVPAVHLPLERHKILNVTNKIHVISPTPFLLYLNNWMLQCEKVSYNCTCSIVTNTKVCMLFLKSQPEPASSLFLLIFTLLSTSCETEAEIQKYHGKGNCSVFQSGQKQDAVEISQGSMWSLICLFLFLFPVQFIDSISEKVWVSNLTFWHYLNNTKHLNLLSFANCW